MGLKIQMGAGVNSMSKIRNKRVDDIGNRARKYLHIIKNTKEYLTYGVIIGWSVAHQLNYSIGWTPDMDKNLTEEEGKEINAILDGTAPSQYAEVLCKSEHDRMKKEIWDEVMQKAKDYAIIFGSRKDYLKYGDSFGYTVAHHLAEKLGWYPEMDKNLSEADIKEILKWKVDKYVWPGASIAHVIANNTKYYGERLWSTKDVEILTLEDSAVSKNIVAFNLIERMWNNTIYNECSKDPYYLPPWMRDENGKPDMKILQLKNSEGKTVAYEYASSHGKYWLCDDIEILKLDDGKGTTVAHVLAKINWGWPTESLKNSPAFKDILKWRDSIGWTVAHCLASYFNGSNKSNPLRGWKTDDPEILSLTDNDGNTVAHILAKYCKDINWTTKDPKILSLKNNAGITVQQILTKNGF